VVTIDVRHDGLGRFERVHAPSTALAERRAESLAKFWDELYERRTAALRRPGANLVETLKKLDADERTAEAERERAAITSILIDVVRSAPMPDWSPLYDTATFAEPQPQAPEGPVIEPAPQPSQFKREPLTLATLINPRALRRRRQAADYKYQTAYNGWEYLKRWRQAEHDKAMSAFRAACQEWESRRNAFLDLQQRANARLDSLREGYKRGLPEAVAGHCDLTLLALDRPRNFPCFWGLRFTQGTVHIDYDLPSMAHIPVLKAVKYVATREVFETAVLSESERERIYGEAVFQTCLAVMHAIFAADVADAIHAVAFNGWVNFVDGTGTHPGRACALSITTEKRALAAIDLGTVDPQACFRALNGSMSAKLAAMSPRPAQ
jgi:restriction system protein